MPWNPTTKMMSMPIGWDDIAQAVGYYGNDIVENGVINMWSKFKFVRLSGLDYSEQMNNIPLLATEWLQNATWWKGSDGKCGINIPEYTALGSPFTGGTFFYFLKNGALSWTYNRPRGPQYYEWQRSFDMFRYYGDAQPPVGALASADVWLDVNYNGQIDYDTHTPNGYELALTDFSLNNTPLLGNYYLGILLWKPNGTFWFLTSDTPIAANQSFSIPFGGAQSLVGTWNVVPFISSQPYTINSQVALAGVYASCFGLRNSEVFIHAPGTIVDLFVNGYWNAANTAVNYELDITNHGSSSRTLTNVTVEIKSTTSASQDPATGQTEASVNLGSVTVAGNGSAQRTGILNVTRNSSLTYWIKAYADNFTNSPYEQIEENPEPPV